MVNKLLKYGNITELENKILTRLETRPLFFGNIIQLAEIKILNVIDEIKNNEDFFQECEYCRDKYSIIDLKKVNDDLLCDKCIEANFKNCGQAKSLYMK